MASTVCVHGLGYIGLPTAAMLANHDYIVSGFDTNSEVLHALNNGGIHIEEPGLRAFVSHAIDSENLRLVDEVVESKYHLICVPTPFDHRDKSADLSYVQQAATTISSILRDGDTVILESTVPPTTTVDLVKPILEESGLVAGRDFALVYCPETVLPGNITTELKQNDRIVGGVNGVSTEAAVRLYSSFIEGEIHTTDATTAEFVKLSQNTFRDTNIALANELAMIARDYGIDSRSAISLANKHPRVGLHDPGPGVGGHCLPIDPWFLGQHSDRPDLIEHAREVNDRMITYIIEVLEKELGGLTNQSIGVLGVAYKGNVDDTRESPGIRLVEELRHNESITVTAHDPHIDQCSIPLESFEDTISNADAIVLVADHDEFENIDREKCSTYMSGTLVIDAKNLLDSHKWNEDEFNLIRI